MSKGTISNTERFVALIVACSLGLVYSAFGLFESTTLNPFLKFAPFLAISFYLFIKESGLKKK